MKEINARNTLEVLKNSCEDFVKRKTRFCFHRRCFSYCLPLHTCILWLNHVMTRSSFFTSDNVTQEILFFSRSKKVRRYKISIRFCFIREDEKPNEFFYVSTHRQPQWFKYFPVFTFWMKFLKHLNWGRRKATYCVNVFLNQTRINVLIVIFVFNRFSFFFNRSVSNVYFLFNVIFRFF